MSFYDHSVSEKEIQVPINSEKPELYGPTEKYVYLFNPEWEYYLRNFDDAIIHVVQYFNVKKQSSNIFGLLLGIFFKYISIATTIITVIENGPSFVIFLMTIGQDYIANWFFVIGFVTTVVAQLPKRFIFRKRPYMTNRAIQLRSDKTSSFPSRAVVCSVVYTYAITTSYNYYQTYVNNTPFIAFSSTEIFMWILLAAFLSSFARIHLGAHFPSDCLVGFLTGLGICLVSYLLFQLPNILGCPSCLNNECYPLTVNQEMTSQNFSPQNMPRAFGSQLLVIILFVLVNAPPIKFWDKSAPILGSYNSCFLANLIMICPINGSKGLAYADTKQLNTGDVLLAFIIAETNLIISSITSKVYRKLIKTGLVQNIMWNIIIFLAFTILFLVSIVVMRLSLFS